MRPRLNAQDPKTNGLASLLGGLRQKAPSISEIFRSRRARLLTCHGPFHPILLDGFLQTLLRTLIHEKSIQDHATRTALDELVTSASFEILCVLGVSAVRVVVSIFTAETQRSPRLRREKRIRTLPTDWVM